MNHPHWVARYRWPETFRFKHLADGQAFGLYGRTYVRISARKYHPVRISFNGAYTYHGEPRTIDSINVPVRVGALWAYGDNAEAC